MACVAVMPRGVLGLGGFEDIVLGLYYELIVFIWAQPQEGAAGDRH